MKEFFKSCLWYLVGVVVLTAVGTGFSYMFLFFGMKEEHAVGWGIGSAFMLLIVWSVSSWAVGKWQKRRNIQKEHLQKEKTEIIAMIDEALEEKR